MIPGLIVIIVGVILFWGASSFTKRRNEIDRQGIPATGTLASFYPVEGGGVKLEIHFTDRDGKARSGMSQVLKSTDGRYQAGDNIPIKYQIGKAMGMDTVRLRVQDDALKQSGAGIMLMMRIIGIACMVFGVILFFLV